LACPVSLINPPPWKKKKKHRREARRTDGEKKSERGRRSERWNDLPALLLSGYLVGPDP